MKQILVLNGILSVTLRAFRQRSRLLLSRSNNQLSQSTMNQTVERNYNDKRHITLGIQGGFKMERTVQIGNLSKIRPVVNYASFSTAPAGTSWGPRKIPDCQLIHVVSGEADIILNGSVRRIYSGDTVFYGVDTPHKIVVSSDRPLTFYSMHFSWDEESADPTPPFNGLENCNLQELNQYGSTYTFTMDTYGIMAMPHYFNIPRIENLITPIVREYLMAEPGYAIKMRGQLYLLLIEVVRGLMTIQAIGSKQNKKIASVLEAIKQEPDKTWKTIHLARIAGYHPTYFAALFKNTVGYGPKHFLILERIRLAKTVLLEFDSIEKAADKLGYSSVYYFSRHFKKFTGFTPSEYKKRNEYCNSMLSVRIDE